MKTSWETEWIINQDGDVVLEVEPNCGWPEDLVLTEQDLKYMLEAIEQSARQSKGEV